MKNSHLIEKQRIADRNCFSHDDIVIAVLEFVNETDKFLSGNFEGLFNFVSNVDPGAHLKIPLDTVISIFKEMVKSIRAKSLIAIDFECNSSFFTLKISSENGLPMEEQAIKALIRTARSIDFTVKRIKNGLILEKSVLSEAAMRVFARIVIARDIIAKRFAEIFFGGDE